MSSVADTRRVRWGVLLAWGVILPAFRTVPVRAEEPPDGGADRPDLSLDYLDGYLELEGDFGFTRIRSPRRRGLDPGLKQRNADLRLEERLGLQFGGSWLDPGFLQFGGELSLGLAQSRFEEHTDLFNRTDDDRGYLAEYDVRVDLLPGRTLGGSVHALRQDRRINRRFQPTLREERSETGFSARYRRGPVSMGLSYDYRETDRTGNRDRRDNEHFTDRVLHYDLDWTISERQRLTFSYEHGTIRQSFQGRRQGFETTRDLFIAEHQLDFGDKRQHQWRVRMHWQEESGDFARDFFEIGPQLILQHNDHLQTRYAYQFNRERYEGLDIESQRFDVQLVHQAYTNLTTAVDGFALYEDIEDDINTIQYGGSVEWQYQRRNRWGRLLADLALAYDTEEVRGDDGRRVVLNEAQTFHDPIAVTLRNRDVIRWSIVVTDTSNRRVYLPGVDYNVFSQGTVTRIARVRTGRIADGDTVLVDYMIRTPQHGQLDTIRVDFRLEQRFDGGLTPYYQLSYRNQEDDRSTGFARRADRTDHHRIGVTYEKERYTLGAYYEIFDDTVEPFDAFHVNGLYRFLTHPDHTLDGSVRLSRFFFEGGFDSRDVTMLDWELDHHWRLTDGLSTVERVVYRLEDDSIAGQTHAWDVTAGLQCVWGRFSGELTFEYDRLKLPGSKEDDIGVYVRIRREMPDVLKR